MYSQQCQKSVCQIVKHHLQCIDKVTLLTFDTHVHEPLVNNLVIHENKTAILEAIKGTKAGTDFTAFYDAVNTALNVIISTSSSSSTLAPTIVRAPTTTVNASGTANDNSSDEFDYWICALTDGIDNKSTIIKATTDLEAPITTSGCNAVFITVGRDANVEAIKNLAQYAVNNGKCGRYINVSRDTNGIRDAFDEATTMMGYIFMETI
jgi:hypothetical protein